ncbi:MAG: response regulator [Desulfobacterales bacterium]|nr:response regulator [Desulfobacterales bacterium]
MTKQQKNIAIENRKILIADDESDMRIFVSTVVELAGFEAVTAKDGAEALKTARDICPDLVILDVMMPKIEDGIHTYQEFKTDENLACIPVIMLSAIAEKTFNYSIKVLNPRKNLHITEPEAYMEKPPDAVELSALIKKLLPERSNY